MNEIDESESAETICELLHSLSHERGQADRLAKYLSIAFSTFQLVGVILWLLVRHLYHVGAIGYWWLHAGISMSYMAVLNGFIFKSIYLHGSRRNKLFKVYLEKALVASIIIDNHYLYELLRLYNHADFQTRTRLGGPLVILFQKLQSDNKIANLSEFRKQLTISLKDEATLKDRNLVPELLNGITLLADGNTLRLVEELAKGRPLWLKDAAGDALPAIRAAAARNSEGATLLRGVSAPQSPNTLLRPKGTTTDDAETLLRVRPE